MLHVKIELMDNEDCIVRTRDFDDEPMWMDIILMCADVVSARCGYNVTDKIKFIASNTTFYDRAHEHAIPAEAWAAFLEQDFIQPEFDFNKQDEEHNWS